MLLLCFAYAGKHFVATAACGLLYNGHTAAFVQNDEVEYVCLAVFDSGGLLVGGLIVRFLFVVG